VINPLERAKARQKIDAKKTVEVRVSGTVQGVGFRPAVWRLANSFGLTGNVRNNAHGVLIRLSGTTQAVDDFLARLKPESPPLSKIDSIEIKPSSFVPQFARFQILDSVAGETQTQVTPDAATCPICIEEVLNPSERRFRYPFANCTHCGPRFSIVESVPYDRGSTTMSAFTMCKDCAAEYGNPADRRFHAQPIACHKCGPQVWMERLDGATLSIDEPSKLDSIDTALSIILQGEIIAVQGLGGFHLACDATNENTVRSLRERKQRYGKPFALMTRDLEVIKRYARVSEQEASLLCSPEAPIVLLEKSTSNAARCLPDAIAPGVKTIGFMLPYMPVHHLLLQNMDGPLVMTSGNVVDEPQVTSIEDARTKLGDIANYALFHNRAIANRIDDSVVRVMNNQPRLLRRARGYAPSAITLPVGFENAPDLLAFGGELKAAFCIFKEGSAILSQHQGDLENAETFDDYEKNLHLYRQLYDHQPKLLAADKHPEYLSTKLAKDHAQNLDLPLIETQHHHAHIASCLAENSVPLNANPVLGIALDGLGFGEDGTIWGGEFLLADYRNYQRLGTFKPVAMLGGSQAIRDPWRNTYAHIVSAMGWHHFAKTYANTELYTYLQEKPLQQLDHMFAQGVNAPLASSCGRLFDAVAATLGLARERAQFEGQGAMLLEAAVSEQTLRQADDDSSYPFTISMQPESALPHIDPGPMWRALFDDLILDTPIPLMSARFHKGLAKIICTMVDKMSRTSERKGKLVSTVALSGGCFQNKVLLERVEAQLSENGLEVLTQSQVPANDGGLALGQAAIAAARQISQSDASKGL